MKYVILHESGARIRIKTPILKMSCRQADLLEYYLKSISEIKSASVDERTGNAVIVFKDSKTDKERVLDAALLIYDENSEEVLSLVPEETGRQLNRKYQEKLVSRILLRGLSKLLLPKPVRITRAVIRSIPFVRTALRTLFTGRLRVEVLDGIAIAASIILKDFRTASSIMFLLKTGEILEEWTRKKSIGDLARSMPLNVSRVWLKLEDSEIQVALNSVNVGDRIVVRASDVIPLDGKVYSGEMTVNQSTMTGEAEPVVKNEGGYVYAGTVVEEGECIIEVTKKSGTGKYDQIVKMIEESEKLKSETEAKAYRLADSLVPYSFLGFALTYALTRNIRKALSFLMVDYSCAMKLSMPLAVLSAIKEAREYGISIKG
ncbi:MAG: heavy metal translocating P-type ATPase, partial [Clostridia bacterium]|nr:heavy metal translocating P-type ATPase [Clostridia bacterium]